MIRVFLSNSETLELREDTEISITLNNPIFDEDSIDRVYTFSWRIGLTPKNRILLKHANRMDNSDYFEDVNSILEIDGFPFLNGTLTIEDFTDNTALASFKSNTLVRIEDLNSMDINSILHSILIAGYSGYSLHLNPSSDSYKIIVNNIPYESSETIASLAAAELVTLINTDIPGAASTTVDGDKQRLDLTGSPTVQFVVNEKDLHGMYIIIKSYNDPPSQADVISHVEDLRVTPVDTHAFPIIQWYDFYEGKNSLYTNTVNGAGTNNDDASTIGWKFVFVPFVRLWHIFDEMFKRIGITDFFGTFVDLPDFKQILVFNNYALDFIDEDTDTNVHRTVITLNDHVPEIKARELLQIILKGFGQHIVLHGTSAEIKFNKDQFVNPPIDWTGKSDPSYKKIPVRTSGFRLAVTQDLTDSVPADMTWQLDPFVFNDGSREIKLDFAVLYDYIVDIDDVRTYQFRTCRVKAKGSSEELGIGKSTYPLKLFFERGIRTDSTGTSYHMSTNGNIDVHDNLIGNFTLRPTGEYGIYEYFFKGYLEYILNPPISKTINLNIGDIFTLRKWDNALRKITTNEGEFVGIVKSVTFKAYMNKSIGPSEVEFIRYATN